MKAKIIAMDGHPEGEVELPKQFAEDYRPDLIHRAYLSERSFGFQPKVSVSA